MFSVNGFEICVCTRWTKFKTCGYKTSTGQQKWAEDVKMGEIVLNEIDKAFFFRDQGWAQFLRGVLSFFCLFFQKLLFHLLKLLDALSIHFFELFSFVSSIDSGGLQIHLSSAQAFFMIRFLQAKGGKYKCSCGEETGCGAHRMMNFHWIMARTWQGLCVLVVGGLACGGVKVVCSASALSSSLSFAHFSDFSWWKNLYYEKILSYSLGFFFHSFSFVKASNLFQFKEYEMGLFDVDMMGVWEMVPTLFL